jgi:hypothetical protein
MLATPNEKENVMRRITRTIITLGVFTLLLAGVSLAQDIAYRVIAKIPFDFYTGQQDLSAGTYEFAVDYDSHLVTMRNLHTGRSGLILAVPADRNFQGNTVVVFESIAGRYMLWTVATPDAGVAIPEPTDRLMSGVKPETVTVAAVLK